MERILKIAISIAALAASTAFGGTTFVQPPSQANVDAPGGEGYSESRFGYAPARVEVTSEADYWDTTQTSQAAGANRAPAGLVVTEEDNGRMAPTRNGKSIEMKSLAPATHAPRKMEQAEAEMEAATAASDEEQPRRAEPNFGTPAALESLAARRKGVQEISLIAGDLGFFPKVIFVTRDLPVRLYVTGASKNTLCIMMDSFAVRKQVRSQKIEEISFTPATPGKFRFYCPVNGMEGTMVVRELGAPQTFAQQ